LQPQTPTAPTAPASQVAPETVTASTTPGVPATQRPTVEPRPTPAEGSVVPITVDQTGFTGVVAEGQDYATFAAILNNSNTEWAAYRMLVLVNFLDSGENYFTGTELQVTVLPGQLTAIAGQVFGAGTAFEMEIVPPEDTTSYLPFASSGTIEVSDVESTSSDAGMLTTGTLASTLTSDQTFLQLFAVYRDAEGDIVGGAPGAVEAIPSGGSVGFEISDTQPPPGVTSTEVYWQLGGQLPR